VQHQNKVLPETDIQKDLMSAIGAVSWQVWTHLKHSHESKQADIARKLKLSPSSVSRAINKLQSYGLVTFGPAEGMYYGEDMTEPDIERLTADLGKSGRSAKQKLEHQRDRERRVNQLLARERRRWAKGYWDWQRANEYREEE
jgi:predicted ArsR family transcriptional regulator